MKYLIIVIVGAIFIGIICPLVLPYPISTACSLILGFAWGISIANLERENR